MQLFTNDLFNLLMFWGI